MDFKFLSFHSHSANICQSGILNLVRILKITQLVDLRWWLSPELLSQLIILKTCGVEWRIWRSWIVWRSLVDLNIWRSLGRTECWRTSAQTWSHLLSHGLVNLSRVSTIDLRVELTLVFTSIWQLIRYLFSWSIIWLRCLRYKGNNVKVKVPCHFFWIYFLRVWFRKKLDVCSWGVLWIKNTTFLWVSSFQ